MVSFPVVGLSCTPGRPTRILPFVPSVVVKLATIDCLISLSLVAMLPGYTKPDVVDEPCLDIVGGRHPIVETVSERPFIPNDVRFAEDGLRALVLTGCNMSGKSSYSRMVALLVVMAQIGCYLPCQSAKIGIVDYVGTRFGASDEITRGRSVSARAIYQA